MKIRLLVYFKHSKNFLSKMSFSQWFYPINLQLGRL